ncbi:hypothetical protein [Legionella gresilensis]|uniref:hypothetical protein n=1 Tax=Legionella gresilensis TaxID=91823 RepID=UPI001041AFD8|nr:hypothetical protein [Legionella gresilensis]
MAKLCLKNLILLIVVIIPIRLFAYTPAQVSEWTEQTLMHTLIAGHHEKISEAANVRRFYKHRAWRTMDIFLNQYLGNNVENNLRGRPPITFQPEPILSAEIVAPEECGEASCWRVHQAFIVPEIERHLEFTAVVSTANPTHSSPLIINTLDIIVSPY